MRLAHLTPLFHHNEGKQRNQKERNNNESTNSIQKSTNPTTSHRTGAGRVDGRSGSRNARVQFFRYTARDGHLSGGLARLDVQGPPGLGSQVQRVIRTCTSSRIPGNRLVTLG